MLTLTRPEASGMHGRPGDVPRCQVAFVGTAVGEPRPFNFEPRMALPAPTEPIPEGIAHEDAFPPPGLSDGCGLG